MKKLYLVFGLAICLAGCTDYRTNVLDGKNIVVHDFPRTDAVKGEKLDLEILGVNVVYVVDTFLIGFKGTGIDHFFEIYTLPNLHFLGKYIASGRGSNEFLTLQYNDQYQVEGDQVIMWLSDAAVNKQIWFNLTESLKQQTAVFDTVFYTPFHCSVCFNADDTTVQMIKMLPENMEITHCDLKKRSILGSQKILKSNLPPDVPTDMAFSIRPSWNKCVASMFYFNQINIFSSDFKERFSISYGDPVDIWDVFTTPDSLKTCYYTSAVASDDHIYALYVNQPDCRWDRHAGGVELQIFNWEGKPERRLLLPEDIIYFAVDEKHQCVYGVKRNEEIYRYDLKLTT